MKQQQAAGKTGTLLTGSLNLKHMEIKSGGRTIFKWILER
jgi:hypothetical protein